MKNSAGEIYYGMHFYPGLAEYADASGAEPYRVYLNEDTIRKMGPTFAGKPIFVDHVDEVDQSLDNLRPNADGWVIESFYNAADGKHWAKFIVVSERARAAIKQGMRLSNAYLPTSFGEGGQWNGITYTKEITDGEYEHLAIVRHPRYDESVIMSPEQFKKYNASKAIELERVSNGLTEKEEKTKMGLKLFKRSKVENALDFEGTIVELPKSKKEMTLNELVEAMDKIENMQGYASPDHMVKVGKNEMSVNDLVKAHMGLNDELESMKKKNEEMDESEVSADETAVDSESDMQNEEEDPDKKMKKENEEKDEDKKDEEKKKNALADKKAADKVKADKLRNAQTDAFKAEPAPISLPEDKVALGRKLF